MNVGTGEDPVAEVLVAAVGVVHMGSSGIVETLVAAEAASVVGTDS